MNEFVEVNLTLPANIEFFQGNKVQLRLQDYIYGLARSLAGKKAEYNEMIAASIWATNQVYLLRYNNQPFTDFNKCYIFNHQSLGRIDEFVMEYIEAHCHTVVMDDQYQIINLTKPQYDEYIKEHPITEDYLLFCEVCQHFNGHEEELELNRTFHQILQNCYKLENTENKQSYSSSFIKEILQPFIEIPLQVDYKMQIDQPQWQRYSNGNPASDEMLANNVLVFYHYRYVPEDCGIWVPSIKKIFCTDYATNTLVFKELDQTYWNYYITPKFKD